MKKPKRKYKALLITATIILIIIALYFGLYIYAKITPKLAIDGANGYYLYDNKEKLYTGTASEDWISLKEISPNLIKATISIEDKNFYKHKGFDFLRIIKALFINFKEGENLQGASTITQQYTKNLFLDFDKTWERKLKEAWLTIRLEAHYKKDDILEGYLNTINYGGIFGIENASKYYFGKSSKDLTLAEASMLAGIPKNPNKYSPLTNQTKAKARQKIILNSMVENKYITKEEANRAYNTSLVYKAEEEKDSLKMMRYYQDAVMDELEKIDSIPASFLDTGGLKIYTNLDTEAQKILEESANKNITNKNIQLAGVVMDPKTGKVLALTGGRDYNKSQYNRATKATRQVGSTIKPFLYYSALENGFTPSTTFTSEKTTFTFEGNKTYTPKNYNDEYPKSPISMAAAIAYSDNIYAVKTHLFLGENNLVNMLKRVGINKKVDELPSLALGAEEINMMEMMKGYAALANEGNKIKPFFISKVTDMKGNVLYEYEPSPENVLNKNTVYILNELLTTTYAKEFVDYNIPTCYNISPKMTKKYAIKSGTTDTDNLIFGYNKDLLVGLWTGYDDNKNVNNSDSSNIKNTWIDIMETYLKDKEDSWYKTPNNVVGIAIDPISGNVANNGNKAKIMYYIKGTEPTNKKYALDDIIPTIKME
ncbi:MAG: PBP1A family penicillin-binding protein [Bacilli bacterium]|nr:PBP1A family penicillin-binding protein [Bacilli bacterium]